MGLSGAPLSSRKSLLGGAIESTSGTAETVTTAFAGTRIYNAEMVPVDLFPDDNRPLSNYGGTVARTPGPSGARLTFRQELRYGDALMTLLQGAGFTYASGPPEVATANWINLSGLKTMTFALFEGGRKKLMYGASCSRCSFSPEGHGRRVFVDWEWMGIWTDPVDASMPSDPTISTAALRAAGVTLTEDAAQVPYVDGFTLNLNPETNVREDVTAATAIHRYQVEDGNPQLELAPESRLVAGFDQFGLLSAGSTHALVLSLEDGAGNTLGFSMPRAQRITVGQGERGKKRTDPVTFELHGASSDGGLVITSTAA